MNPKRICKNPKRLGIKSIFMEGVALVTTTIF
jgi:hypothetical protein